MPMEVSMLYIALPLLTGGSRCRGLCRQRIGLTHASVFPASRSRPESRKIRGFIDSTFSWRLPAGFVLPPRSPLSWLPSRNFRRFYGPASHCHLLFMKQHAWPRRSWGPLFHEQKAEPDARVSPLTRQARFFSMAQPPDHARSYNAP